MGCFGMPHFNMLAIGNEDLALLLEVFYQVLRMTSRLSGSSLQNSGQQCNGSLFLISLFFCEVWRSIDTGLNFTDTHARGKWQHSRISLWTVTCKYLQVNTRLSVGDGDIQQEMRRFLVADFCFKGNLGLTGMASEA